ncbi:hypothetical protein Cfor_00547 [Coptotermes formosanus]|uniref:DUF4817 domain-containing protein n=1 Tax=Coptotermes formosanus TaxID=36987 RepID=A0A6L2PS51_COPFO|nr:hypothetical protein Cfor_00547 [Coptotermes formosanus]
MNEPASMAYRIPHSGAALCPDFFSRTAASIVNKKPPGRPRTVRTPETVGRLAHAFQRSSQRSARRHSIALHLTPRTVRRILHEDLKFHPFKIQVVQQLLPRDLKQRSECCRKLLQVIERTPQFLDHLIMSGEAHFHLNGNVNKQNFIYWAAENPHTLHQKPLHGEKVTVWCGVSAFGGLGPYFSENATGQSVTDLKDCIREEIQGIPVNMLRRVSHGQCQTTCRDVPYLQWSAPQGYYLPKVT